MIPDWLINITKIILDWHGSLPDWLALLVGFAVACVMCVVSTQFLAWVDKPRNHSRHFTCHACGNSLAEKYRVRCVTSSDPRSAGTELCQRCFDERVLQERWAHLPGIKWFDQ